MRTLLDVDGSIETARQGCDVSVADERKIDQVVSELDRYQVVVGALQETKWFGSEEYRVGHTVVLTSGREVPGKGEVRQRSEGVAIVQSGGTVGSQWKAWSSRLITVTLEVGSGNGGTPACSILLCSYI